MHEIYDCDKRVYVPTIYEPVRKTDRVFVLRDGVIYEWDNTVTEQIAEDDLRHFNPTNLRLVEDNVTLDDVLGEIVKDKNVTYQSNDTNHLYKTESYLFKQLVEDEKFGKTNVQDLDDSTFNIADLAILGNIVFILAERGELPLEVGKKIKESCRCPADVQAAFWIGRKEKSINKLLTAWFAVSKLCEKLKADKEAEQAAKPAKQTVPSVTPAPAKAATNPVVPSVTPAEADKS